MASDPSMLTKWAYIAEWFMAPISIVGWLSAQYLAFVFGVSELRPPNGYIRILLIRGRELHDYVPTWLAYLYNCVSVIMIVSIALVVFSRSFERKPPQS